MTHPFREAPLPLKPQAAPKQDTLRVPDWIHAGMEYLDAARRTATDILGAQNDNLLSSIRNGLRPPVRGPFALLAGEGAVNLIRIQRALVELAQRQSGILGSAVKSALGESGIAAMVGALNSGVETLFETQQEILAGVERYLRPAKSVKRGRRTRIPEADLPALARESATSLLEAQRELTRIMRRQIRLTMRSAMRGMDLLLPALDATDLAFGAEFLALHASPVYYGIGIPRGDGSAVLLIPGFLSGDLYLLEMHAWLLRIGYRPYFSGIGLNAECPNLLIKSRLAGTVDRAIRETRGKVHLIGHSLGGMIARSLARQYPHKVASVITLGSPYRDGGVLHSRVLRAAEVVREQILIEHGPDVLAECYTGHCACDFVRCLQTAVHPSIPETAIYTTFDRVIDWNYCTTGDPKVDLEVLGTHSGLPFNPLVYNAVASRLSSVRSKPRPRRLKPR